MLMGAFTSGDVLQVLLVSVLFGCALSVVGEPGRPLVRMIDNFSATLFKMMGFIIKLAPLGVLGAVAFTVGKYGIGSLKQLGFLVILFYGAVLIFVLGVLGLIMK